MAAASGQTVAVCCSVLIRNVFHMTSGRNVTSEDGCQIC